MNYYHADSIFCPLIGLIGIYTDYLYIAVTFVITLNLQLTVIQGYSITKNFEWYYWGFLILCPFIICVLFLGFGIFGDTGYGSCFINKIHDESTVLLTSIIVMPRLITCLYCCIISIFTIRKIKSDEKSDMKILDRKYNEQIVDDEFKAEKFQFIKDIVIRISYYPIMCILIWSGQIAQGITVIILQNNIEWINTWSSIGFYSAGILNLIAFIVDPHIKNVRRRYSEEIIKETQLGTKSNNFEHELVSVKHESEDFSIELWNPKKPDYFDQYYETIRFL